MSWRQKIGICWFESGVAHVRVHQIPECGHVGFCTQNFHIYTLTPLVKLGVVFKSPYSSQQGNNEKWLISLQMNRSQRTIIFQVEFTQSAFFWGDYLVISDCFSKTWEGSGSNNHPRFKVRRVSKANQEPSETAGHEPAINFEVLPKTTLRMFKGQNRVKRTLDVALVNSCFTSNAINSGQQTALFSST